MAARKENVCVSIILANVLYNIHIAGSNSVRKPPKNSLPVANTSKPGLKTKNKPLVFTKKENATLAQRIEILEWHNKNGRNHSKTTCHFNPIYPNLKLKQPIISDWAKNEKKWQGRWKGEQGAKCMWQTQHPEIMEMLDLWVSQAMKNEIIMTGEVLHQKWIAFATIAGIPEDDRLKLSDGWLEKFKAWNGLKEFKRHGDAASSNPETVEQE